MQDALNLKNQVCFPIYVLAKEVINHYRPLLDKLELTYPQYLVMLVLWEEQKQTVNQLGEKLMLDSGTLTPLLKRLEQKEFISRNRSKTDERVVIISLTEKGNSIKIEAECIPEEMLSSLNLTMDDLVELKNIMNKILNKIIKQK